MQSIEDFQLEKETYRRIEEFDEEIRQFREEGPLDPIATKKLQEFFRIQHIFHSTGIEGNRLSLRETEMVVLNGLVLGDKPIGDQEEVRNLDAAFDYLLQLVDSGDPIREIDIRELQKFTVRNKEDAHPGTYRTIGVVITGSEHTPPEPIAVPSLVQDALDWLNTTSSQFPILGGTYVHHQITSIHPFVDGNGRVARLLMNLIFLRCGYPIVNIRREDRPQYYEALTFADVGLYSPLVGLILDRAINVFTEMKRVREETERMRIYAEKWGQTEAAIIHRREEREYRHWLAQIEIVRLSFENLADLLNDKLREITIGFQKYSQPDLSKYLELREKGRSPHTWFFRIRLRNDSANLEENFVFNFYRHYTLYPYKRKVIPLVLNRIGEDGTYGPIETPKIRLREILFDEKKQLNIRFQHGKGTKDYSTSKKISAEQAAQEFFDDVLRECFGLKKY